MKKEKIKQEIIKKEKITTYISLIRGINVNGQKKIKMEDLKELYSGLNFRNVTSYIQSGNIIFNSALEISAVEISNLIEKAIFEKYNFNAKVFVRTVKYFENTIEKNPFTSKRDIETEKLYVTFLDSEPVQQKVEELSELDFSPERFEIVGKNVYLYCPIGYGKTKLSNNFFESKLKVKATTRNWNTINQLLEIQLAPEPIKK